jgi:hypothetical protein
MNFLDLYDEVVTIGFPSGQPENLVDSHKRFLNNALWDISKNVECVQFGNVNIINSCATYFNCGMTVLPAPRGHILKVYTIGKIDSVGGVPATKDDWCSKVFFDQVEYCHIEEYVKLSRNCGTPNSAFSSALVQGLFGCGWRNKRRYPCPTDVGFENLPSLPQGFHYPQSSTDAGGRSRGGVWALYRGRIYIAPWIESDETAVVEWNGIKDEWSDADLVEDNSKFRQAVLLNFLKQHYSLYEQDQQKLVVLETQWREALRDLIHECREQNRIRTCGEAGGSGSSARGLGSSDVASALYYNETQSYTASCPVGQVGTAVTVTIPAGQVGSALSIADANATAMAQAQADAISRLSCSVAPVNYLNTAQSFTANCPGASGDTPAATGNSVTIVIPAGQFLSTVSQAAADAQALAAAQNSAESQLVCTFYNAPQSYTASCPTNTTGSDVQITIPAADYSSIISQADANSQAVAAAQQQATAGLTCAGLPTFLIGNSRQEFTQQVLLVCTPANQNRPSREYSTTAVVLENTYTALVTAATQAATQLFLNQQAQTRAQTNANVNCLAAQNAFNALCIS